MNIANKFQDRRNDRRSTAGFTLIELMVAITISLLLLVALTAMFLNLSRSNNEMAKTNIQIENGRFAMQLLQTDIAHAGFWGAYVPQFDDFSVLAAPADVPNAIPDPCLAYDPLDPTSWSVQHKNNLIGIPLQGSNAVPTGCAALLANQMANTDVLVVRHAETCEPGEGNCEAEVAGKLYFQSALCATETSPAYVLDTTGFSLHKKDCASLAGKRQFVSSIYYIRDYANAVGDGIPTLVRSQFDLAGGTLAHQPPVALIEGIEAFRVEYGIDSLSDSGAAVNYAQGINWADEANLNSPTNRGDGIADGAFIRCTTAAPCSAAQMVNVVAVKLYLVARSREATPGYTDSKTYTLGSTSWTPVATNFKRHVFSSSVRLHNISARRETP
jgi:type IV pilus assembly protein PilW